MGPSPLGRKLAWLSSEALTAAAAVPGLLAFSEVLVQQQPERSIAQWQALMSAGAVSAVEIVEHDLARIDAIDHSELKAGIDAYLRERPDAPVRGLADVIAFNAQNADRVMPYFRQEFLEMAQAEAGLDDPAYLEALAACRRIARDEGIDRALREQRLDVLIAPTGTPAWVTDPIDGDRLLGLCSSPAAVAGYPHVTVPAGFVHGLPVGLSLFAGPYQEGRLLAYAHAFEQAADARRPPTFPERVA